ncbi:MAG TPA: DUF917 family protein [Thermomicrobiaceae bacterium]|nr:DUF917 family protein [Thermomicrobiaceae bacterium]
MRSGEPSATCLQTEQDCLDFVRGCTSLATGAGGSPERGVQMLLQQIELGRPAGWVDPASIPGDVYTVSVFGMGDRSARTATLRLRHRRRAE